nr:TRAP transporter substrate-binding protein [uncultured Cohaesibacter sp.]
MKNLSLCAAALLCTAMLTAPAIAAEEFTAVGTWSSVFVYQKLEKPFWEEKLPAMTDGEFSAQITSLDQMGISGADVYRMLGDGVFDVGTTIADYAVGDAPELEGLDVPLLAMTPSEAHKMVDAAKPMLKDIFRDRFNSEYLGVILHPPQIMFCRDEIASLEDLKGKKIRGSGRMTTKFLDALGAEGVNISFSEVPGSLERGVIDCAITGSGSGFSAGWWEVSNYVVNVPLGGWDTAVIAMNKDRFDGLSAEQQKTLKDAVVSDLENVAWDGADGGLEQDLACLTGADTCKVDTKAKMTLVELSDADMKKARDVLINVVLPDWASRTTPDWVKRWNDSVGKVTGVSIAQ